MTAAERRHLARLAVIGVLIAIPVIALLFLLLGRQGTTYEVGARFQNASQLVGGEPVVVAGTRVGSVKSIELADNGAALVDFSVDDRFAPLHRGTVATVRSYSLSGLANRQVQLTLPSPSQAGAAIPNGGQLSEAETVSEVDLDEVLDTLNSKTTGDLKKVIAGLETSYAGVGRKANRGYYYLNPLLSSSRRVVDELTADRTRLRGLVSDTSRLSSALASRAPDLSALVHDLNVAMGALGGQRAALASSIRRLPVFLRQFNSAAVNLRATLDDLDPAVTAARPLARRLTPFFSEFRAAAAGLVPTSAALDPVLQEPGPDNDLVDLVRSQVPLSAAALGPVQANGASRRGALTETTSALTGLLPQLSFLRAYTPEAIGWMDDFGHSGIYDVNGGLGRIAAVLNTFSAATPGLPLITQPAQSVSQQLDRLVFNLKRCPGSLERNPGDGSTPFTENGGLDCDPSQTPVGP